MTEKQAQKVFDKYNPANVATRCPNGRAHVRKLLDVYAQAAVNLYGVISKAELADIFNRQNIEKTTADEILALLLPIVLKTKNKWYCFYKDYIVHYWAIDDFDYADYWLSEQGDKPRFIPDKDEFLKFKINIMRVRYKNRIGRKFMNLSKKNGLVIVTFTDFITS